MLKKAEAQLSFLTADIIQKFSIHEFVAFVVMALFLNLYPLSNFLLSIDDEFIAYDPYKKWLTVGRWTAALIDRYVFPQPIIPYVPYAFFSICLALAYIFLIWAHNLPRDFRIYLAMLVFITYPIWQFIGSFDGILPAIGVGVVLVALSGLLLACTRKRWLGDAHFLTSIILQVVMVTVAIGAYQSFLLMYLGVGFGIVLTGMLRDRDPLGVVLRSAIQILAVVVVSTLLYYIIAELAQWLTNISASTYLDSFLYTQLLFSDPLRFLRSYFVSEAFAYYSGSISKFGVAFPASGIITLLSLLSVIVRIWHEDVSRKLASVVLWSIVIATPFLFNVISIVLPTRSLFPIAYAMWLMTILLLSEKRRLLLILNIVFVCFLILQSVNINGLYNARLSITQQSDRLLAADLYDRIAALDATFDRTQPIFIDVYGKTDNHLLYPGPGTIGSSFFSWDDGRPTRMVTFMRLLGYSNLNVLPDDQRLKLTPYFEKMPAWPATGCVQKVDGVYLIKLSRSPDKLHQQFYPAP